MTFPAARERKIDARNLLRHHPQREDVAGVWTKTVAAILFGHCGREQAFAEEIVEVFGGESCGAIVFSGAWSELLARQGADAIDEILLGRSSSSSG